MITNAFFDLAYRFLAFIISLLPSSQGFPAEVLAGAQTIGAKIGIFEPIMPLATMSLVLGILFSAEIGIWTWKSFKWLVSHIPFIGGRGH